nr:MAG TPA: hypothetical protein [Caudoviricetes sp.]
MVYWSSAYKLDKIVIVRDDRSPSITIFLWRK